MFSWEVSKLLQSILFCNIFICVEELNYVKDYLNVSREAGGREPSPHFTLSALERKQPHFLLTVSEYEFLKELYSLLYFHHS